MILAAVMGTLLILIYFLGITIILIAIPIIFKLLFDCYKDVFGRKK